MEKETDVPKEIKKQARERGIQDELGISTQSEQGQGSHLLDEDSLEFKITAQNAADRAREYIKQSRTSKLSN
jgi:hypothetical protein